MAQHHLSVKTSDKKQNVSGQTETRTLKVILKKSTIQYITKPITQKGKKKTGVC